MSCVAYWNQCQDCNKDNYNRHALNKCEHCGGTNIEPCVEYDEDFAQQDAEEKAERRGYSLYESEDECEDEENDDEENSEYEDHELECDSVAEEN